MIHILGVMDTHDVWSLLFLIPILVFLGSKMAKHAPGLILWAHRFACAAFLAYCVFGAANFAPETAGDWLCIVIRALITAGLTLGIALTILPAIAFLWQVLIQEPRIKARAFTDAARRRARDARERRTRDALEAQRVHDEENRRRREREEAADRAEATRRCADIRTSATLMYSRLAHKVGKRFTQKMFDDFLATSMGDENPPDDVERRFQELCTTWQQILVEEEPPAGATTLENLVRWHQQRQREIDALPIEDRLKRLYSAQLSTRVAELSSEMLQNIQPNGITTDDGQQLP